MIISYENFELQAVRHRVSKAHQRRWAMASVLHTRRMSIAYKLRLWSSCVLSTMTYALHCLCLRPSHVREVQKAIMKHVRAIIADQAFITGRTHQDVMDQYGIQSALQMIAHAHSRELRHQNPQDWMLQPDWDQAISDSLRQAEMSTEPFSDAEREIWACPICDEQFISAAALKVHAGRKHNITTKPENIFDRQKHSVGGLPQYSGCLKKFSRWQTLRHHINNHSCTGHTCRVSPQDAPSEPQASTIHASCDHIRDIVSDDNLPKNTMNEQTTEADVEAGETRTDVFLHEHVREDQTLEPACDQMLSPLLQQSAVQQLVVKGLNAFIGHSALQLSMLRHCVVCGQWVASQRVMKRHFQHSHNKLLQQLQNTVQRLISQKATPCSTCHYCGRIHKDWKAHLFKCTSLWQCAFMCAYHQVHSLEQFRRSRQWTVECRTTKAHPAHS